MTMHVNVGGNWQTVAPNVKVGNTWQQVQQGWVKVNGVWQPFYSASHTITINSNRNNLDVGALIRGRPENDIYIVINPGVTIGATNAISPAFNLGAEAGKTIHLINHGNIIGGRGDRGSAGSNVGSNGGNGGKGGPAIFTRTPLTIDNRGNIHGGGGGGGGGGGVHYKYKVIHLEPRQSGGHDEGSGYNRVPRTYDIRSAGGSGGYGNGGGGSSPGAKDYQGSAFGGPWLYVQGGRGGNGGTSGANGSQGATAVISGGHTDGDIESEYIKNVGRGGAGGAVGNSIDGNSRVTIKRQGDIRGPRVN